MRLLLVGLVMSFGGVSGCIPVDTPTAPGTGGPSIPDPIGPESIMGDATTATLFAPFLGGRARLDALVDGEGPIAGAVDVPIGGALELVTDSVAGEPAAEFFLVGYASTNHVLPAPAAGASPVRSVDWLNGSVDTLDGALAPTVPADSALVGERFGILYCALYGGLDMPELSCDVLAIRIVDGNDAGGQSSDDWTVPVFDVLAGSSGDAAVSGAQPIPELPAFGLFEHQSFTMNASEIVSESSKTYIHLSGGQLADGGHHGAGIMHELVRTTSTHAEAVSLALAPVSWESRVRIDPAGYDFTQPRVEYPTHNWSRTPVMDIYAEGSSNEMLLVSAQGDVRTPDLYVGAEITVAGTGGTFAIKLGDAARPNEPLTVVSVPDSGQPLGDYVALTVWSFQE